MLSRLVLLCWMMCWNVYATTKTPSTGTLSTSARMQQAYNAAKAFALALPPSHIGDGKPSEAQDSSKREEETNEKCFTKIDLSRDVIPCERAKTKASNDETADTTVTQVSDKILVFVSLSMPKESLKQLARDAITHNAVLILRGLKDNSFKETVAFLKTMGQGSEEGDSKAFEGGFEINPMLFDTYSITHVPVFIHVKKDQEQARLSGNVTLAFASKKLMKSDGKDTP